MTTSISAIETLFTNNIINYDTRASLIKRVERLEAKEESRKLVQGTADSIIALLESDVQTETKYFSVKKTSNSVGFMDFVETDRATVLKALTLLVSQDKIKKIGLVGGEVKLPTEVNAFQIRYMRS
jgi:hypothetical protein|tara:strand:+ start:288 stop:665 length:378 start_codon:yes stop_codon:yes gene_type:complete